MFDHDRDFPRAYTVPGIAHELASTLGVRWALHQAERTGSPVTLYAPARQDTRDLRGNHPAVYALRRGASLRTWRSSGPGPGVVIALWPDEEHLMKADEARGTEALVAVTWSSIQTLPWAQAKIAEALGGPRPDIGLISEVDPVIAEAIDSLASWWANTRRPISAIEP